MLSMQRDLARQVEPSCYYYNLVVDLYKGCKRCHPVLKKPRELIDIELLKKKFTCNNSKSIRFKLGRLELREQV
jgi:hypothetical protein